MDDLVDQTDYVVDVNDDGVALLVYNQLATEIDLTPPQVNIAPPPLWEWETVPPISVLAREIAARIHPGDDATGWLYALEELIAYEQEQERLAKQGDEPG